MGSAAKSEPADGLRTDSDLKAILDRPPHAIIWIRLVRLDLIRVHAVQGECSMSSGE